jgi:hypothetical protein
VSQGHQTGEHQTPGLQPFLIRLQVFVVILAHPLAWGSHHGDHWVDPELPHPHGKSAHECCLGRTFLLVDCCCSDNCVRVISCVNIAWPDCCALTHWLNTQLSSLSLSLSLLSAVTGLPRAAKVGATLSVSSPTSVASPIGHVAPLCTALVLILQCR